MILTSTDTMEEKKTSRRISSGLIKSGNAGVHCRFCLRNHPAPHQRVLFTLYTQKQLFHHSPIDIYLSTNRDTHAMDVGGGGGGTSHHWGDNNNRETVGSESAIVRSPLKTPRYFINTCAKNNKSVGSFVSDNDDDGDGDDDVQ